MWDRVIQCISCLKAATTGVYARGEIPARVHLVVVLPVAETALACGTSTGRSSSSAVPQWGVGVSKEAPGDEQTAISVYALPGM